MSNFMGRIFPPLFRFDVDDKQISHGDTLHLKTDRTEIKVSPLWKKGLFFIALC